MYYLQKPTFSVQEMKMILNWKLNKQAEDEGGRSAETVWYL